MKVIKLWERFILLSAPWLELWTHQQQIVKWRNQGVLKFIFAPNVSFGVWNFLWAINIVEQFLRSFWWRETSLGRGTTLEYSSGRLHTDFFIFCSWHLKNFILVNKDVEHNWFYEALGETPHFQSCQFLKKKLFGEGLKFTTALMKASDAKIKFQVNQTWMWICVWFRTLLFAVIFVVKNQRRMWEENHFRCEKKVVGSVGNSGAGQSEVWDIVRKSQVDLVKPQNSYTLPFLYIFLCHFHIYICISVFMSQAIPGLG